MGKLFGGDSKQTSTSESGNTASGYIQSAFAPRVSIGNNASSAVARLLGLGGSPPSYSTPPYVPPGYGGNRMDSADVYNLAQPQLYRNPTYEYIPSGSYEPYGSAAVPVAATPQDSSDPYQEYLDNAGFQHILDTGRRSIEGSRASLNMLNSGATMKRLVEHGQKTGSTFLQQYLDNLFRTVEQGTQAGGLISNAGQYSKSTGTSSSSGGIGSTVGAIASAVAASDIRLKEDIEKVHEYPDGLGIYSYRYKGTKTKTYGVMAQEVARLRPYALGPVIHGYMTVDYGRL